LRQFGQRRTGRKPNLLGKKHGPQELEEGGEKRAKKRTRQALVRSKRGSENPPDRGQEKESEERGQDIKVQRKK